MIELNVGKNKPKIIGALFILATISYASGSTIIDPLLGKPVDITTSLIAGSLLELINIIAVVCIGYLLFSVLKRHSPTISLIYLGTRILEATFLLLSILSIFLFSTFWYHSTFQIAMIFLGLGSLPFCYLLYTKKLIPQWLSIIGIAGYIMLFLWGSLELFGYTTSTLLFTPGALFEILFPIWLIIKGFNSSPEYSA